jgi:hypothetical protein
MLPRARTRKSGRPLSAQTIAIREAFDQIRFEQEQMTVRGVFYAMTVKGIVEKSEAGYRQVQRQVLLARREGRLPWSFIADGTRWVNEPETWDTAQDVLQEVARTYRRNLWRSQNIRIEVWLEKDALASLIAPVTRAWGIRLMVSRGQSSDTYIYSAARDAQAAWDAAGVETLVLTLYDADRSGRCAAAKIAEKLVNYSDDVPLMVVNLAVTDEQIAAWALPTRPAKENLYEIAVELDAIPPDRLIALVENTIVAQIDEDAWKIEQAVEASERDILVRLAGQEA